MIQFAQNLIDATSLGCLYALYALSIAMIFGVARIVNFANGELITIAAYALLLTDVAGSLPALLVAVCGVILVALGMERFAFRRIVDAPVPTLMVMSLGISSLIQNVILMVFGSRPQGIVFGSLLSQPLHIGALHVAALDVVTILALALLGGGLIFTLSRTSVGIQLRAAAEDFQMARLLGVRANRVVSLAFAISGVMAAAAGVILSIQVGTASYTLGTQAVILGFIATVLGGLGTIAGAAIGGFILGFATVVAQLVLPSEVSSFRDAFVFGGVILVLLFRPQGLFVAFGRRERA
jgi:branched-chain amino acid transport system permease protein